MEQERCEEITQVTVQTQQLALGDGFASPTPTKSTRSIDKETGIPVKTVILFSQEYQVCCDSSDSDSEFPEDITELAIMHAKAKDEIPDKHKPLAKLFDHLSARISVLNLFHMDPTFQNICTEVNLLTLSHLAQMKYLLPEAIHIETINARVLKPPRAICMMPDLKITLSLDVVQADPNRPVFLDLRRAFYQSLVEFSNSNSESCEIPEAELPWPFSQKDHTLLPKPLPVKSSIESHPTPIEYESVVSSPLYGHSFKRKRYFSSMIVSETEKAQPLASLVSPISVESDLKMRFSPQKDCSLVFESAFSKPPTAPISGPPCSNSSATDSLPVELAPIPRTLTVDTPVQPAPANRVSDLSSCEKMNSEARIPSHMAAKRSLTFDMSKEYTDSNHQTAETKSILADDNVKENINHIKTQTGPVKRQQMLASLSNLIYTIERIFKFARSSLITKEELLQKIIANDLDIVDIREVEEQLELLEELVPDWILRKWVPSGDLFYSIRRVSDLESILTRLSKAV